jgi:signal transduction histidine kinase
MNDLKKQIEFLKEQINEQERLASLGMLSAGIAHEIQNPLNFVINFSKLSVKLLKDIEDIFTEVNPVIPEDLKEELVDIMADLRANMTKIEENGNRASSIVKGILLYSRGKDDAYIPTALGQLVHEYVWLSYHAVRANNKCFNVNIVEKYAEDVPLLNIIPQDLSRVVVNLMNNACYAVFFKAKEASETPYNPTITIELKKAEDAVELTIEDNGCGMSDEVKEHLFTPFFTTKPVGDGTGLGLSICKSIIEDKHNGRIEMETEANVFTRFIISLPIEK